MTYDAFPGGETPPPIPLVHEEVPCKCGNVPSKNRDKFERKDIRITVGGGYLKAWRCITCKEFALEELQ